MKKTTLTTLFILATVWIQAQSLGINDKFPIEKFDFYKPTANPKIVVCMPSLYEDCEYASMLTNALYFYFQKGMTFENEKTKPIFDIILLVNDTDKWKTNNLFYQRINQNITDGMTIQYDSTGRYFKEIGVPEFKDEVDTLSETFKKDKKNKIALYSGETALVRNHSSTLFLLDSSNTIVFKDENYRSQGEHLKPLDNFIKENFCDSKINKEYDYPKLKIGDKAPNFLVEDQNNLNSDNSNLKVITFYPAAFSGTLKPKRQEMEIITCVAHLKSFDIIKVDVIPQNSKIKGVKRYAVSNATDELLRYWERLLGSSNIIYLNDKDNSIAGKYNVLNALGYNNRVTYIIDEKNIIRYIDEAFTNESDAILTMKINEILNEK